jgi:hypothetical protein
MADAPTAAPVEQVLENGGVLENSAPSAAPVPDTDIRDLLTSAFKDDDGKPAAQADGTNNDGRERDASGRFVPKTEGADTQAGAAAVDTQAGAAAPDAVSPPPTPAASPQIIAVPPTMSFAEAQQFTSLPAEMQQFVARTLENVEQRAARYTEYDQIEQLVAPRREALAMNGESVPAAMQRLLAYSDFAGRDPEGYLQWFAEQHGMDLAALAEGRPPVDPQYAQLQQTVQRLESHIQSMTDGAHNASLEANRQEVQAFAGEAGTDGKPLRPYYQQLALSGELGACVVAVRQQNPSMGNKQVLEEAYNRACWANPTIRQTLTAAETATAEAQRLAEQREHAGRAQNANVALNGAPRGTTATEKPSSGGGSVRDELRNAFAAADGGV